MPFVAAILFSITTLGISYQDFKQRAVHVVFLLLLFALGVWEATVLGRSIGEMLFSLSFVTTILTFMTLYLRAKAGFWVNPLKEHLGLGDVLFFLAVIPLFSPQGYMWFFISGLLGCLLVYTLLKTVIGKDSIPLAGMLSVYLLGLKILESQAGYSLFNLILKS